MSDQCLAVCAGDPERGVAYLGYSPLVRVLHFRADVLARTGGLAEAGTALEQALALARPRVTESEVLCWALAFVPHLAWLRGEDDHSVEPAEEAVRIGEESGNLTSLVLALDGLALAHLMEGRPAEAAAACERALTVAREKRSGLYVEASVLAHLAQAHLARGDVGAAATAAHGAVATARCQGARVVKCLALLIRARVGRARSGETDAAGADVDAALALSREVGALTYEPFIREELGRLHGDESELREALRLYEAIGAVSEWSVRRDCCLLGRRGVSTL